jgi:formylmethanofuran dehydrogenase subunit B
LRIGEDLRELASLIGLLRARAKGKRSASTAHDAALNAAVTCLQAARFGIVVFDPADLDALAIENINGLVRELNAKTRFTTLRRPGPDNANGVNEVSAWLTSHPVRVGFGRGFPEHDPWLFEAGRLVESGEVDVALWISTIRPTFPAWAGRIPMVALVGPGGERVASDVLVEVGSPAVDHDAVLFNPRTGALAHVHAVEGSNRPTAAYVLREIEARLAAGEQR